MSRIKNKFLIFFLSFILAAVFYPVQRVSAVSSDFNFIILSQYNATADIGDAFYLVAVTSNGKHPTWKSSDSKIASVNTYGKVTAKKGGVALITAKIKNAEASCQVIVNKTGITINKTNASIENGETLLLSAITSNGSKIIWKSSKKSIAVIDQHGMVTSKKPGETVITASADGSSAECILTVKSPSVQVSKGSISLFRGQSYKLSATVSSKITPKWKTNKKSVALVNETGTVTAVKNGTATITVTVDGVASSCEVTVKKPDITLNTTELTLKKGTSATITATVTSGNLPVWTSSNSTIVSVNSNGELQAKEKGTAYIYATEDGTKAKCKIHVIE